MPTTREYTALVFTAFLILVVGLVKPGYNWDMIGYVAAAHHYDGVAGAELTERVYTEIAAEVGPQHFERLTQGDYVGTVYADPESLAQQLPFYTPRLAYIELMRVLKLVGISYAQSTYLISAAFAFASIILVGRLCVMLGVSLYWLPSIAFFGGFAALPRLSTPDAFACFFSLLALYFLVRRSKWLYLCIALLPLVRTDFIICSGLLAIYTLFAGNRPLTVISGLVALASYFLLNKIMGNYGYLTIFNFTLIGNHPYPATMPIATDFSAYLKPYLSSIAVTLKHPQSVIYILAVYLLWFRKGYQMLSPPMQAALWISVLFILAHLALFPSYQERFLAFANTMIAVIMLACLSQATRENFSRRGLGDSA